MTDDSELAICLARGLLEDTTRLNLDNVAMYYKNWIDSRPFDIGNTTRNALGGLYGTNSPSAEMCMRAANIKN